MRHLILMVTRGANKDRVLVLFIALTLTACGWSHSSQSRCKDTVISKAMSPDGKYVAATYHRVCGNPGEESRFTYAELRDVPPHFWSTPGSPRELAYLTGFRPLSVRWDGKRRLVVITPKLQEIDPERKGIGQDTFWKDVDIHYE